MGNTSLRRSVCFISFATAFLTPWMVSSVNIALPSIGRELSMGAVAMSWVTSAYLLSSAVFLVPFGKIADIYGRRKLFLIGVALITLSSLSSALAGSGVMLIATRVIHGVGASMVFGTGMAMLTAVFPPEKRGRVLGINVSFTYTGLMAGPVLGGIITRYLGWRTLFWINIPIGLAVFLIAFFAVRQEWKEEKTRFSDPPGAMLYGATLILIITGLARLASITGVLLVAGGVLSLAVFFLVESSHRQPVFPVDLFKTNRLFAYSNFSALINYSATYALVFLMSLYLQYLKGLSPDHAGFIMIVQPVMMVLFSPLSGRLSDRFEPRILSSAGMGCIATGLFILSFLTADSGYTRIIINLMLIGFGFALFSSPNISAALGSVERRHLGTASATIGTMRLIGQVLSMGMTMFVLTLTVGTGKITPKYYAAFERMMAMLLRIFSGLCLLGTVLSAMRGNVRTQQHD